MRHLLMLPISHRILSNLSCGMSNIRFALSIKYASSAAYQQVIKLGVLALPHSCPVLPTNVLDSSDSLTLSFQSWEDPGFLGYPRILPSYPSHTAAHAVKWIPSVQVVLGCAICWGGTPREDPGMFIRYINRNPTHSSNPVHAPTSDPPRTSHLPLHRIPPLA